MTVIYVADEHHRLYWHWKDTGARALRLAHVDFHCDMRGLLIDRRAQRARVHDRRELGWVDQGNYLTHAVSEGMVESIDWVHDPHGGRRYDLGTVRYARDLRSRLSRDPSDGWSPLDYRELSLDRWPGPGPGEHLDLDWDALACRVYPQPHARALQEAFLARDFPHRPDVIYFIYSYCSSHIDDDAFEAFLEALRRRFDARVERLSPLPAEHSNREHAPTLKTRLRRTITAPLKGPQRWLTYRLKAMDGGDDLAFRYPPRSAGVEGDT